MNIFIAIGCVLYLALILTYPQTALCASGAAVHSWLYTILPSLMPYCAAATMLAKSGILSRITRPLDPIIRRLTGFSGGFIGVLAVSLLSGYPNGARLTGELLTSGQISEKEASFMVNATSFCGPSFIICAVCTGMLGRAELFCYILIPHYIASLIIILINGRQRFTASANNAAPKSSESAVDIITNSVASSAGVMLNILAFTVILAVLNALITAAFPALPDTVSAIIACFTEMTEGTLRASRLDLSYALVLISFAVSFGGLSVILQTLSQMRINKIKAHGLIASKLVQGVLSAALTLLLIVLFPPSVEAFFGQQTSVLPTPLAWVAPLITAVIIYISRRVRS